MGLMDTLLIRNLFLCHFAVNHAGKVHKVRTCRAGCGSAGTRTTRAAARSCTAGTAGPWTSWTTGATHGWWRFAQALPDLIQGLALSDKRLDLIASRDCV